MSGCLLLLRIFTIEHDGQKHKQTNKTAVADFLWLSLEMLAQSEALAAA